MNSQDAIVIFSGGQDSTTCLYWALSNFHHVAALTFAYDQKHRCELDQSRVIARKANVPQKIISLDFMKELVSSELINQQKDNKKGTDNNNMPSTYVPMRNQLFLTLAYAWATTLQYSHIVIGVCETDYSGYYDCRDDFVKGFQAFTNLAYHLNFKIHTPLMHLSKGETFDLAEKVGCLDIVLEHSHSCYEGDRTQRHDWGYGCGLCAACQLRKRGWKEYCHNKENGKNG